LFPRTVRLAAAVTSRDFNYGIKFTPNPPYFLRWVEHVARRTFCCQAAREKGGFTPPRQLFYTL
jgi:hypothetical protein